MPAVLTAAAGVTAGVTALDGPADPALGPVTRLLAEAIPADCAGLVPYHAPGYAAFLSAALAPPAGSRTVLLRCVRDGTDVLAVADWRWLGRQLLLNGIAVARGARGSGLGGALLADGLRLARRLRCAALALDVSRDNAGARRLYRRFGFAGRSHSSWAEVPIAAGAGPGPRFADWPAFAAHRAAYGFGDLRVLTAAGPVTVRAVGPTLRVPAGPEAGGLATTLAGPLGATRAWAVRDGWDAEGFARFTRMLRPVTPG
ncbi:GNAT family N-acetyltransferase [Micromonospora sp. CA-111912]|uniref:GNAT family N-acetyltransferase n=1 Tax=Micromonospora sp. CA-111912 TaxID=3239955 RepID=UPI003D8B67BB